MNTSKSGCNGYSLIRKVIEVSKVDLQQDCGGIALADALIKPTRIYTKQMLQLTQQQTVYAIAHITGGGLIDNIPRVLPDNCSAHINLDSWQLPPVFQWLQQAGNIQQQEMFRTFNCGVGMVLVVDETSVDACIKLLNSLGEQAWHIGHISEKGDAQSVELVHSGK